MRPSTLMVGNPSFAKCCVCAEGYLPTDSACAVAQCSDITGSGDAFVCGDNMQAHSSPDPAVVPTPATHSILTGLKAGETVYETL